MIPLIREYFTHLTDQQLERFDRLTQLYPEWNDKINVISRKDIGNLEEHHLLHSLAIGKFIRFAPGSKILDFGCGGGLPGIPLAILMPDVSFHLIDRIGKKIKVVQAITDDLGLDNVTSRQGDIGECRDKFDFIVSRAVMPQEDLLKLSRKNLSQHQRNAIPNGLISLKGGNLDQELHNIRDHTEVINIEQYFPLPYFSDKKIVYTLS